MANVIQGSYEMNNYTHQAFIVDDTKVHVRTEFILNPHKLNLHYSVVNNYCTAYIGDVKTITETEATFDCFCCDEECTITF